MSKHTPGPWKTKFARHAELQPGSHVHVLTDKENFNIGLLSSWVNDPNTKAEAEANANLIAAAPDLLEALEQMMVCFDDGVGRPWNEKQLDAARAAIARAKGEK